MKRQKEEKGGAETERRQGRIQNFYGKGANSNAR